MRNANIFEVAGIIALIGLVLCGLFGLANADDTGPTALESTLATSISAGLDPSSERFCDPAQGSYSLNCLRLQDNTVAYLDLTNLQRSEAAPEPTDDLHGCPALQADPGEEMRELLYYKSDPDGLSELAVKCKLADRR